MVWCNPCERGFQTWHGYEQHMRNASRHNWCEDCNIDFDTWTGLKEHWAQSGRHDYCQNCDEHFSDEEDLEQHYDDVHYWCRPCNKVFKNEVGLDQHHRQSPIHSSCYCSPCKRLFRNESNLRSHMNSSIHRAKDIRCPGRNCNECFVSQSALVLHLEAGTCSSGITRAIVNKVVRERDTSNIITDPSRLITSGSGRDEVTYIATSAAWNGSSYECYLCHRPFGNLRGLNQHLASPRHQDKIYLCPLSTCKERFNALSGLCQHIESERCGVLKFAPVRRALDSFVGGMRIAF